MISDDAVRAALDGFRNSLNADGVANTMRVKDMRAALEKYEAAKWRRRTQGSN